jgi:hypothetical protein
MNRIVIAASTLLLTLLSGGAAACVFGAVYNLPIPFGMYAYGATAALVASFAIVGYVLKAQPAGAHQAMTGPHADDTVVASVPRWLVTGLSLVSVLGLVLTIASGLLGTPNRLANFGMTFFWIVFALGLAYATALLGDVYALINPWRALCRWVETLSPSAFAGRIRYPAWFAYYPALFIYMGFVWIELFGQILPDTLSIILIAYTLCNLFAAWLFGKDVWFRYGEFFSVFFRLIGKMAPVEYVASGNHDRPYQIRLRKPFVGLLHDSAEHVSLLLFVIFMLSSTAFDGAHETLPWVGIFWKGIYPALAAVIDQPYFFFLNIYYFWQSATLLLLPVVYLVIYVCLLWLAKIVADSDVPLRTLALRFAFTLIPIAFVYNLTHYYTDLLIQGVLVVRMISDPFNFGWNLFGTSGWLADPIVLDAGGVWHTQVGLILFGHIVSVYLAHVEALKVFPMRRHAMLSQLPMLVLMVLLTTVGLWILSLPIGAGQVAVSPSTGFSAFAFAAFPPAIG